ncbi:hypothetical protein [Eubacterium uniforme]|nr:hypothetical protein [Eubacterium uniforme]
MINLIGEKWTEKSWVEEQDLINKDNQIDRRNSARILHMYLLNELNIKDADDITPAYVLKDLFDCRVCANHIAQVYLRGLMESVKIGEICIFDLHGDVKDEDIKNIKCKLNDIIHE